MSKYVDRNNNYGTRKEFFKIGIHSYLKKNIIIQHQGRTYNIIYF